MRDRSKDMTVDDFVFIAFMTGATLIHKQLKDRRLTSNRYVADRRWMADLDEKYIDSAKDDVVCWFKVPYNTVRSISLERWAEDCEKTGLGWEIRQDEINKYCIFLFLRKDWLYNKQIRSFESMMNEKD